TGNIRLRCSVGRSLFVFSSWKKSEGSERLGEEFAFRFRTSAALSTMNFILRRETNSTDVRSLITNIFRIRQGQAPIRERFTHLLLEHAQKKIAPLARVG